MLEHITKIQKRSGDIETFDQEKIQKAVFKALTAAGEAGQKEAQEVTLEVVRILNLRFEVGQVPQVEQVQDIVEEILMVKDFIKTARAFILYRDQRRRIRELGEVYDEAVEIYDQYISEMDWQVKENANMAYSLQGLNNYGVSSLSKRYWLNKIYPKPIRDALESGDFHIHDLDVLGAYCCGWDLYDLLIRGFGGVKGKVECAPAKHLSSALGQVVNFLYTLQGECYSSDTEVLTENGWKFFPQVKEGEKVFTLNNETNTIEFQTPTRFYQFDHNGPLFNFKSKKLDLLVTENHNMVVDQYCPNCKTIYHRKFVKAKDFNPNLHFIPKQAVWNPEESAHVFSSQIAQNALCAVSANENSEGFALPSIKIKQYRYFGDSYQDIVLPKKDIALDDWLAFFGFFLAEGSTSLRKRMRADRKKPYFEYQVRISQNVGENFQAFEKILQKLPFRYNKRISGKKAEFRICDKQLYLYLLQFGKASDKFIPKEIKNLPKEKLQILFDWMMRGDGYQNNGNIEYATKSKRLADDFQEISLKLGWSANIYLRKKGVFSWYDVGVSRAKRFRFMGKENISQVAYIGKVYCLEVPNHTLYVRRKGKACWCGNSAGAQAMSSFDTLLAPFIRYDNLSYDQVKKSMQSFMFNCAVPTRVGFQTPFSNITLDLNPSPSLAKLPVIIGGKPQKETYADFQAEMDLLNRAFYEVIMEGDKNGRIFTFPIPTVNITKDFDWQRPALESLWQATAKYGVNYFANFIQSDMNPEDVRSMCCRLRLSNKELLKKGGGLFGANPQTGSIGVVTVNMPRLGYLSKTRGEFFQRLGAVMDLSKDSLEIKRKAIEDFMEKGLYPYSKYYLSNVKTMRGVYYGNHFSTIGLLGLNECLLNFMGETIASTNGRQFALEVLNFMRERIIGYQEQTDNLYNLESTPAEGASFRLALKDKKKYENIITAGTKEVPYYTNSSQLPVNYTDDVFEALDLQDELQCSYTGGTVCHIFLGERLSDIETVKHLVKTVFTNYKLPYITLTPTFSICPVHGYLSGEHWKCPQCMVDQDCEVYSRVVGYLRPVQQWHKGKTQEFKERKVFTMKPSYLKKG